MLNLRLSGRGTTPGPETAPSKNFRDASDEERRLARALDEVLGKRLVDDNVCADSTAKEHFAYDPDATGTFEWIDAETEDGDDDLDHGATPPAERSQAWLRRAQSQQRWANTSSAVQRLLLCVGFAAFVILTVWPGLS